MNNFARFFIDGAWVEPVAPLSLHVINPATETVAARISMGSAADVDKAVTAARHAFPSFSRTSRADRLALLGRILQGMQNRYDDLAEAVTMEMGSPLWFAKSVQVETSMNHFREQMEVLETYEFETRMGTTRVVRE